MISEEELSTLSGPDSPFFLAVLASELTIAARLAYRGLPHPDAVKLVAANEVLHAVNANLIGEVTRVPKFGPAEFSRSIRERAGPQFTEELELAISKSLARVRTRNESAGA